VIQITKQSPPLVKRYETPFIIALDFAGETYLEVGKFPYRVYFSAHSLVLGLNYQL